MSVQTNDPREMILAAFAAARASGKKDWRQMTTAVLKSRLMKLTDGSFDEGQYTKRGMRGFVAKFPDLVALDDHRTHPLVTLLWAGESPRNEPAEAAYEVVPDEWRRSVRSSSVDTRLIADLAAGKTVALNTDWKGSALIRRRLRDAMRRRGMRLQSGRIDRSGAERAVCWAEPIR
ncbi:MAG TPA: hypothetical protein VHR55_09190 [Candidatus Limnocylindria bacterium]|nr:hypothetical protein [Candidatus Limnocylindria bacterium]